MASRFYTSLPLAPGIVELTGPEAHHLATVSRLRAGDTVCLFNGDGHEYPGRVLAAARKSVQIEVLGVESPQRELPFALEVAAPLPKGDRGVFLIEKLTELGVTSFVPISCERSVVHPGEGKREKLERHVIEACKQCGRNVLMQIGAVVEWTTYCAAVNHHVRLIGDPAAESAWAIQGGPKTSIGVAVGPEGGFTEIEMELARDQGWRPVGLGPRILRIETAALALSVLSVAYASGSDRV